jgi:mRNA-degrading endonuclease YafQ of YafQ-DinJ toxin-antitoxin module
MEKQKPVLNVSYRQTLSESFAKEYKEHLLKNELKQYIDINIEYVIIIMG